MTMMTGSLGADKRRALRLLGASGPQGLALTAMHAHGFTIDILATLVRDGLATTEPEIPRIGGGPKIARMRLTEAGRRALAE
jgi:hypothetical protein